MKQKVFPSVKYQGLRLYTGSDPKMIIIFQEYICKERSNTVCLAVDLERIRSEAQSTI